MKKTKNEPKTEWGKLSRRTIKYLKGNDFRVYSALITYVDENGRCFPAIETLADDTGINHRNVQRHLANLELRKFIKRTSLVNHSNVYHLPSYKKSTIKWGKIQRNTIKYIKGNDFRVYSALITYANKNGQCFPAVKTLADDTAMTPHNVNKHLANLEKQNWIKRIKRLNHSNIYQLYYISETSKEGAKSKPKMKESKIDLSQMVENDLLHSFENDRSQMVDIDFPHTVENDRSQVVNNDTLIDYGTNHNNKLENKLITNYSGHHSLIDEDYWKPSYDCEYICKLINHFLYESDMTNSYPFTYKEKQLIKTTIREQGILTVINEIIQNITKTEHYFRHDFDLLSILPLTKQRKSIMDRQKTDKEFSLAFFDLQDLKEIILLNNVYVLFEYIKVGLSKIHEPAFYWEMSLEDDIYCDKLLKYEEDDYELLSEKLYAGLRSAIKSNQWTFGQIVYHAVAVIEIKKPFL